MIDLGAPAIAALLGASIPTAANIAMTLIEPKLQRNRDLLRIRNEVYDECLEATQDMADHAHLGGDAQRACFQKFSRAKNRVAIYGNTDVAKAMSNYYNALVDSAQSASLSSSEHQEAQSKIVNSIRKDLELEGISNFRITSNRIPSKPT